MKPNAAEHSCSFVRFSHIIASKMLRATGHVHIVKNIVVKPAGLHFAPTLLARPKGRARRPVHARSSGFVLGACLQMHQVHAQLTNQLRPNILARRCLACRAQRGPLGVLPKAKRPRGAFMKYFGNMKHFGRNVR